MYKLPTDFKLEKYGICVRLVQECDAEFIIRLRTDSRLSRFIHDTPFDIEKQVAWIRQYKVREHDGTDYYFLFLYEEKPVGVCRIYHITEDAFTFGSWIFLQGLPFWIPIAGAIIGREIGFETLGKTKELEIDGTHILNSGVISFSRQLGMNITGERQDNKGIYLTGILLREEFEKNKTKFINKFPQKQ